MKILNRASEGLKRVYTVFVSAEELEAAFIEKLKERATKLKIDGFRKGKVPIEVVQRLYGDTLRKDSVKDTLSRVSKDIIEKEELSLSYDYVIDITKENEEGVEFELKFEIVPKFTVEDFSAFELTRYVPEITDAEVNAVFDDIRKSHKKWIEEGLNTKIREGHKVSVELRTKMKLKNRRNTIAHNLDINIGDPMIMDAFWKPLIDKKAGDLVNFVVNYPKNLKDKNLAGKKIEYSALINKVSRVAEYELDDDLAKSLGYENFEKLREWAKGRAEARYKQISLNVAKRHMMEKIVKNYDFDVPSNMFTVEFAEVKRLMEQEAKKLGKTITPYIEGECKKIAEERVRLGFIVAEIARLQNISISKEEAFEAIRSIAALYPGHEKAIFDMYSKGMAMNTVLVPILEEKVFAHLLKVVKITEKPCTVKELIDLDEEEFDFFKDEKGEKENKENKSDEKTAKKSVKKKKSEVNSENKESEKEESEAASKKEAKTASKKESEEKSPKKRSAKKEKNEQ